VRWALHDADIIFKQQKSQTLKVCRDKGAHIPEFEWAEYGNAAQSRSVDSVRARRERYEASLKHSGFIKDEARTFHREVKRALGRDTGEETPTDEDATFAYQQKELDSITAQMSDAYREVDKLTIKTRALQRMVHWQEDAMQLLYEHVGATYAPNPYTMDDFKKLAQERPSPEATKTIADRTKFKLPESRRYAPPNTLHRFDKVSRMSDQLDRSALNAQTLAHALAGMEITIRIQREAMAWHTGALVRARLIQKGDRDAVVQNKYLGKDKPYIWTKRYPPTPKSEEEAPIYMQDDQPDELYEPSADYVSPDQFYGEVRYEGFKRGAHTPPASTFQAHHSRHTLPPGAYDTPAGQYAPGTYPPGEEDSDPEWDTVPGQDDSEADIFHRFYHEQSRTGRHA
jgi:hypothetical protein